MYFFHSCHILSPSETGFIGSAHRLTDITLLTLIATLYLQGESLTCILNKDTQPVMRTIGVSSHIVQRWVPTKYSNSQLKITGESILIIIFYCTCFSTASDGPSTAPTVTWSTTWWPKQPRVRGTPLIRATTCMAKVVMRWYHLSGRVYYFHLTDSIIGGAVGEGEVVCVCQVGRGAGMVVGNKDGWWKIFYLSACYMQMPNNSRINYGVEGRKVAMMCCWLYFDAIYMSSDLWFLCKILRVLLQRVLF